MTATDLKSTVQKYIEALQPVGDLLKQPAELIWAAAIQQNYARAAVDLVYFAIGIALIVALLKYIRWGTAQKLLDRDTDNMDLVVLFHGTTPS